MVKPPVVSPSTLRRYDRVMRELATRFPAMLPARFGTCVSEDELRFILSSRRIALRRALSGVRGRVQMTVRVVTGTRTPERTPATSGATGRDYLMARAREAATARAVPGFEPVRSAVARWVRDERVEHRAGVSSVYHLIPRASIASYRKALQASAAAAGIRLVVSGPWPPYAFGAD
jgi:hypothetical protein